MFFSGSGTDDELDTEPRRKDSVVIAEDTGEFVYNMATYGLRDQVNLSSKHVAKDVDELAMCGLTPAPCNLVKCPRIAESPVNLECKHHATLSLPSNSSSPSIRTMGLGAGRTNMEGSMSGQGGRSGTGSPSPL